MLEDLRAEADVFGVIRAHHPQAQDVRTTLLHDLLRRDDVAERFRHLAAVFVERETVGQHGSEGGASAGPASLDQRGLKPAAMLVRPFEVEIGWPSQLRPLLEHEGVSRARIEPYLDDVRDLFPLRGV